MVKWPTNNYLPRFSTTSEQYVACRKLGELNLWQNVTSDILVYNALFMGLLVY